jgi:hypothetical protein
LGRLDAEFCKFPSISPSSYHRIHYPPSSVVRVIRNAPSLFHLHNSHARYSIRHLPRPYSRNARLIPAIILRLHYLSPTTLPAHRNLAASYATVCAQLQLGYGIFAATVPCLKPFVAVWEDCGGDSHGDCGKRVGGQRGMEMKMGMGKGGESASSRVLVEQEGEEMN